MSFGERLLRTLEDRGPLSIGIDPSPDLMDSWGLTDGVPGLSRFCEVVVQAFADRVAVLKPQAAFFERFGSEGIAVLEETISEARRGGAIVLYDVKRGDIASTNTGYASAYLHADSPLACDAITVNPYSGFAALRPYIDTALENDTGIFVWTLASNPEAVDIQLAVRSDGRTIAQSLIDDIAGVNAGMSPLGSVGAVIGATLEEMKLDLSQLNGPILAPGLGPQGGTMSNLKKIFGENNTVIPTMSRGILQAGPDIKALRAAAEAAIEEIG